MRFENEQGHIMRKRVLAALAEVLASGKDLRLDDDLTVADRLDMNLPVIHNFEVVRTVCRKGYRQNKLDFSEDPGSLNDPAILFNIEVELRDAITPKIAEIVRLCGDDEREEKLAEARAIYKTARAQAETAQSTLESARLRLAELGEDPYGHAATEAS